MVERVAVRRFVVIVEVIIGHIFIIVYLTLNHIKQRVSVTDNTAH